MAEKEVDCECIVCGKKYTLPLMLIEDNFYTIEIFYCQEHVKEGNILKVKEHLLSKAKEDKFEMAIMDLCAKLDEDVYIPVKEELAKSGIQHNLGKMKEDFKSVIEQVINGLKKDVVR